MTGEKKVPARWFSREKRLRGEKVNGVPNAMVETESIFVYAGVSPEGLAIGHGCGEKSGPKNRCLEC